MRWSKWPSLALVLLVWLKKTRDRSDDPVCGVSRRWSSFVLCSQLPRQVGRSTVSVCFKSPAQKKVSAKTRPSQVATEPAGLLRFPCHILTLCFHFHTRLRAKKNIHRRFLGGLHSRKIRQHPCYPTARSIVRWANCRQPRRELLFAREAASPPPADSLTDRSLAVAIGASLRPDKLLM